MFICDFSIHEEARVTLFGHKSSFNNTGKPTRACARSTEVINHSLSTFTVNYCTFSFSTEFSSFCSSLTLGATSSTR